MKSIPTPPDTLPSDGIRYPGERGEERLGMPVGGLGTSTFEIGRDGAFKNNRLQNAWIMSLPFRPTGAADGAFLALHIAPEGNAGTGRILQLDAPGGLPGIAGLQYTGHFPFVTLEYEEPAFAGRVSLEAFSPFVPLDADDSSLPIAFLTLRVRNPTSRPLTASAAVSWVNDMRLEYYFKGWPTIGNRNDTVPSAGAPAVRMTTLDESLAGSEYLLAGLPEDGVQWQAVADWWPPAPGRRVGRNMMIDASDPNANPEFRPFEVWRAFLERGALPPESGYDDGLGPYSQHQPAGAVAGTVTVPPGEIRTIPFALVWYFPHHYDRQPITGRVLLGHHYAQRFPGGAPQLLKATAPRRALLRERSLAWRRLFDGCTLSPALRALTLETLYLLPRITWWTADDRFYILESINCPRVNCAILTRYYAAVMAALFPELQARYLRAIADAQLPSGEIPSTLGLLSPCRHEYRIFNSGDAAIFPLGVVWQALWHDDPQATAALYPALKRTLQWAARTLDDNQDGIPDVHGLDQGWDDFVMHGCVGYIADQWLAALRASESLARRLGDAPFADWCRAAFDRASTFVEARLWNGEYYDLSVEPRTGESSAICFSDQFTYGTVAARLLNLGDLHPPERVRAALGALWRLNIRPVPVVGRTASNPDGTPASRPGNEVRRSGPSQSNGFSPVMIIPLACTALQYGRVDDGLALLDDMAQTLVHQFRDPWSARLLYDSRNGAWFYGLHYSDCLIVWEAMAALLGLALDAPAGTVAFRPPRLPARLPLFGRLFTGRVTLDESGLELQNASDTRCQLRRVSAEAPDGRRLEAASVTIPPGGTWRATWSGLAHRG